eukprot:jgi/Ulvmu1/7941/UM004_0174.1
MEDVQVATIGIRISLEDITSRSDPELLCPGMPVPHLQIVPCHSPPPPPIVPHPLPTRLPPQPDAMGALPQSPPQARGQLPVPQPAHLQDLHVHRGGTPSPEDRTAAGLPEAHATAAGPRRQMARPVDVVRISTSAINDPEASPTRALVHDGAPPLHRGHSSPPQPQMPSLPDMTARPAEATAVTSSSSSKGQSAQHSQANTATTTRQAVSQASTHPETLLPSPPAALTPLHVEPAVSWPEEAHAAGASAPQDRVAVRHSAWATCTLANPPVAAALSSGRPDTVLQEPESRDPSTREAVLRTNEAEEGAMHREPPATLAGADAMRAMQLHPQSGPPPVTPARTTALPKVPQTSPAPQPLPRRESQAASTVPPTPPDAHQRPDTHLPETVPRSGMIPQDSAGETAAAARTPGRADATLTAASHANTRDEASAAAALAGHVATCDHSVPAMPPEGGSQHAGPAVPAPAVISQLDLAQLFQAAEQQAAARLAASHAQERELQRCQQDAIARSEEAAAAAEHAQQEGAFQRWRRRATLTARRSAVQQEGAAMLDYEAAWAAREEARQRDVTEAAARIEALKGQLLQKAEELEGREARLVAAEAAALRQRVELERTHGRHAAEASAAIGRLQAEFAHRLQLEQRRTEELLQQRGDAAAELQDAQAEAKQARAELQSAQAQPPPTPPEGLRAAAAAARRRAAECEARRADAEAAAAGFTEQLELMAKQLQQARDLQAAAREAVRRAALEPLPVALQEKPAAPAMERTACSLPVREKGVTPQDGQRMLSPAAASGQPAGGAVDQADLAVARSPMEPRIDEAVQDVQQQPRRSAAEEPIVAHVARHAPGHGAADEVNTLRNNDENTGSVAGNVMAPTYVRSPEQEPLAEVKRLFQERSQLLSSGCYTMDDVVITQISDRISQLNQTL